jgi:hypothetical protein
VVYGPLDLSHERIPLTNPLTPLLRAPEGAHPSRHPLILIAGPFQEFRTSHPHLNLLDPIDVLNCETFPNPAHRLKEYDILWEYGSPYCDPWIDELIRRGEIVDPPLIVARAIAAATGELSPLAPR